MAMTEEYWPLFGYPPMFFEDSKWKENLEWHDIDDRPDPGYIALNHRVRDFPMVKRIAELVLRIPYPLDSVVDEADELYNCGAELNVLHIDDDTIIRPYKGTIIDIDYRILQGKSAYDIDCVNTLNNDISLSSIKINNINDGIRDLKVNKLIYLDHRNRPRSLQVIPEIYLTTKMGSRLQGF